MISRLLLLMILSAVLAACSSRQVEQAQVPEQSQPTAEPSSALPVELSAPDLFKANLKPLTLPDREAMARALGAQRGGDIAAALALVNGVIQSSQPNSTVYVLKGDLLRAGGDQDGAMDVYRQALNANGYNYMAHNRLASLLRSRGRFDEAKQHYERALAAWPGYAPTYLNMGILYDLYLGDKARALTLYQQYETLSLATDATFEGSAQQRQVKIWLADLNRQLKQ